MTQPSAAVSPATIVSLLQNIGTRREINEYLSMFRGTEPGRFAVIKVGGEILRSEMDSLTTSLSFLRSVGLTPIVVHGAGPQLSDALRARGVEPTFIGGVRVTCPETLAAARAVFQSECARLCAALVASGAPAQPVVSGVFEADRASDARLGLVGEITGVDLTLIRSAIYSGQIPVVSSLAHTVSGQTLNVNADSATRELAIALQPRKVIFLTPTGGLLNADGAVIPAINLAEDMDRLLGEPWIHGGMALKLREIQRMLAQLPRTTSVSITNSDHLVRELFTHKGHGTLIQMGMSIRSFAGFHGTDVTRLGGLLESSFGRTLVAGYFDRNDVTRVYAAEDYSAAAIVTTGACAPYLDKFAVTPQAQGAGVGSSLWSRLVADHPSLIWRSRAENPINPWYFERATGTMRTGKWVVFWRGVHDARAIELGVKETLARAESFAPKAPAAGVVESKSSQEGVGHVAAN
ncbi:MAG: acetylglutamate kinase [Phycisphaerales bacterium]|nr:acetylglutamate kinase [Phycisphaerales bacterium]